MPWHTGAGRRTRARRANAGTADWPGLASNQLFEGRDLRPTLDTRQLLKGVLGAHYDLRNAELNQKIFPNSGAVGALDGLLI